VLVSFPLVFLARRKALVELSEDRKDPSKSEVKETLNSKQDCWHCELTCLFLSELGQELEKAGKPHTKQDLAFRNRQGVCNSKENLF